MTREEALQRIVDNNFAGKYGFDMQIFIDCMVVAREIILNSQFPVEDCISRQGAIDALGYDISIESDEGLDAYRTVIKEMLFKIYDVQKENIEKLPCIQPKAKMGYWIYRVVGIYRYASCSECNKMQVDESNYCPNCGARMVEPQESDLGDYPKCNTCIHKNEDVICYGCVDNDEYVSNSDEDSIRSKDGENRW